MSDQRSLKVNRTEFSQLYRAEIQHRQFVEYPEYYYRSEERFWQGFHRIQEMGLPTTAKVLDIGGGIMGVLLSKLLGFDVTVADVTDEARQDVTEMGLGFVTIDLFTDEKMPVAGMDLVILQEVIEHIPQPPYIVLEKLKSMLAPGGLLFMTTPNGHRFRNVLYMIAGREILDIYRYPDAGDALGHQHEYTMKQMLWQVERAGLKTVSAEYYRDGWQGNSLKARIAWAVARVFTVVPRLNNGLALILKMPT